MKNQLKIVALLAMVGLFFLGNTGCHSPKKIQASISKKDTTSVHITQQSSEDSLKLITETLDQLHKAKKEYTTFSAKIKVEYEDAKGKQPNITAYVRMIKDSVIWVSGYATLFNIEAFRILINKDSVFIVDKINKEVRYRSIDFLQEVSQIPFDLSTLQNLLVGNPVFFQDSIISYKETESKILIASLGESFKHLLTLKKGNRELLHSKLDDVNVERNRTADITYADYEYNFGYPFSTTREIVVSEKNRLDINLNYKQYEFNKDLSVSFNIPKNYKRK
ncbi:MAG: DUF4292 domain-containing protein [Ferruginibacter sp.]